MDLGYFSFRWVLKTEMLPTQKKVFCPWSPFGSNTWVWFWKLACSNYSNGELNGCCTNTHRVYLTFPSGNACTGNEISRKGWSVTVEMWTGVSIARVLTRASLVRLGAGVQLVHGSAWPLQCMHDPFLFIIS